MKSALSVTRLIGLAIGILFALSGAASAQAFRWESNYRFPGTFFPAYAISAAGKDAKGVLDNPNVYGYLDSSSFGVRVLDAPMGAVIKVHVEIPAIGVTGDIETTPQPTSRPRFITPRLSWNQNQLASIAQPLSTEIIFQVSVNGGPAEVRREPLRVRAVTDMPIKACPNQPKCTDYSEFFAAFVNENHPAIDQILRAALDIPAMPVKQWLGTQGGEAEVLQQVWAIWYLFQRNKVTYSNITTTSESRPDLLSQAVRPVSQSLRTSQANCIDGTVLFASILRKIDIEPIIILIPGHAFLGFYLDPQHRKASFLETTWLNAANNPFNQQGPTKTGTGFAKMLGMDTHMAQSNQYQLQAFMRGSNLHALWDTGLIKNINEEPKALAARLQTLSVGTSVVNLDPVNAAQDSCTIVSQQGFYPKRLVELPYIQRYTPVVEQQLTIAGTRLAGILNVAFK